MLTDTALCLDEKGESHLNYAQWVEIWSYTANAGFIKRVSALISDMDLVARGVRMVAGSDQMSDPGCAMKIKQLRSDFFAPDPLDSVFQ